MNAFEGRPDLLIIFVAQIAFIIVQILIYLRVSRAEKQSHREQSSRRVEKSSTVKNSKTAKRKLGRRSK